MGKKRDGIKEEKKKKGKKACCEKEGLRRGAWSAEEDKILVDFITQNGHSTWRNLLNLLVSSGVERAVGFAGLTIFDQTSNVVPLVPMKRIPLSICTAHLNITVITMLLLYFLAWGWWAAIASNLPGRTDNDIKNFWNSHLRKRFSGEVLDQTSSLSKSVDIKHESPPTRLLVQSENVRAETAESRLSSKSEDDYLLCLWNFKVGESLNESISDSEGAGAQSPASQTSSFMRKVESGSRARNLNEPCKNTSSPEKTDQKVELLNGKKEAEEFGSYSDDSKSDDSSDTMLNVLLDFPVGGNDMEFLQDSFDDVSTDTLH
ncbi:Transcription factor [Sesamum angolense]|uniref:Transcription factor n=1 Tax=Sesamum angolense TaxID=2727404 RepID=A0AAE1X2Q3_9LAMI|nr:Transcription factor [Sesamum angolense]